MKRREVARRWKRANATRDCWDEGFRMHGKRDLCFLRWAHWAGEVSNGRGLLHQIAASLLLDGLSCEDIDD